MSADLERPSGSAFEDRGDRLRIDNVLSTQPELGPNVPDGGYGWVVLFGTMFFQLTVPSLSIAYGVFLMFSTLEESFIFEMDSGKILLWDNVMIYSPIFFTAIGTITDPACRLIVANSRWPRLVGLGGTCLLCAGILFFWLAVVNPHLHHELLYSLGGTISGIGASLILAQCEILISQFFRLKLQQVNLVLWISSILGFSMTPVILGHYINIHGLAHVIIWYHLFVLLGVLVCGAFRKPAYLKSRNYGHVRTRNFDGDEEDIFSKTDTELKTARHQTLEETPSTSDAQQNWEKFSEDDDTEAENDLRINGLPVSTSRSRSPQLEAPKDLFTELTLNNNTTYSFDNANVTTAYGDDTHVFMPLPKTPNDYNFLLQPSFYKTLFLQITLKYSMFAFCTAFPSILYFSISGLHKASVTAIVGYIFCSCVILALMIKWCKVDRVNRAFCISIASWICSIGFYMVGGTRMLSGKIIGGILTTMSIYSLESFGEPYLKPHIRSDPGKMHTYLNILSGLSLLFLTLVDMDLVRFYQVLGSIQFMNGTVWFGNYILKRLKGEE